MSQSENENAQYTEYEDPTAEQKQQPPVSLATNPIYNIESAPNYEFLSNTANLVHDPVARETSSETSGSLEYENVTDLDNRKQGYDFVDAIQSGAHEYQLVTKIGQTNEENAATYEGLIQEYSFDVKVLQTPDVKELGLTRRYTLVLGNLSLILRPRVTAKDTTEPEPIYTWYYADIRRYSFSKQLREFAIYCGRSCATPEKVICFLVKTDFVQLLQVVNEKTGGAFEMELANMKIKRRVCVVS